MKLEAILERPKLLYELARIEDIAVSVVGSDEIEIVFIGSLRESDLAVISGILKEHGLKPELQEITAGFGFGVIRIKLLEADEGEQEVSKG